MRAFIRTDGHDLTAEEDRLVTALRPSSLRPARFGRRVNAGLGDLPPRQKDVEGDPGEELERPGDDGRARGSRRTGFLSLPKPEAPGPRRENSARIPRVGVRECGQGESLLRQKQKPG